MRTRNTLISLVAAMSLLLGLMALPAAAFDVVVFTGTATVCADTVFDDNEPPQKKDTAPGCGAASGHSGKNNGLYLIGHPGGKDQPRTDLEDDRKWMGRYGNYEFSSGGFPEDPPECLKYNPLGDLGDVPVPCEIKVNGLLAPVFVVDDEEEPIGIGAACGMSEGLDGEGHIIAENGSVAQVWDVGWPASAGGTLPIKGDYHVKENPKHEAKPVSGQFVGVVQAQGGANCIKTPGKKHGASEFDVVGVVEMTPAPKKKEGGPPPKKPGTPKD